jgi:hypothetical protein
MKQIDKLSLIDKIGRELQRRMSYRDIAVYLTGFGVDTSKSTSSVNSKWVYVKNLLADEADETIFKIADELEIRHGYTSSRRVNLSDTKFWMPAHFRLFLSHVSTFKAKTALLQQALRRYGISAFVAHNDIEPTKEWQDEIEKALFSMDCLAAILTPGFKESKWADQEVGVAVGRDVLIVPIRRGLDPYGFIAKYQGLQGEGKTIPQVAGSIFEIVANHAKTKERMAESIVDQVLLAGDSNDALSKLVLLTRIPSLPERHLGRLRDNAGNNSNVAGSEEFVSHLNSMLKERGLSLLAQEQPSKQAIDDDLPF